MGRATIAGLMFYGLSFDKICGWKCDPEANHKHVQGELMFLNKEHYLGPYHFYAVLDPRLRIKTNPDPFPVRPIFRWKLKFVVL